MGDTFLRNKLKIAFFFNKVHIFLVEKKTLLNEKIRSDIPSYDVFFSTKKCAPYLKKCNFVFVS